MTLLQVLETGEFWAALFGAGAAFLLEALHRWHSAVHSQVLAGNAAIFALSQMYTLLRNIHNQFFVDRRAFVQKTVGREPLYCDYLPAVGIPYHGLPLPMDELRFLLQTHDPDILNRLVGVERGFSSMYGLIQEHNRLHVEFQGRMTDAIRSGKVPPEFSPEHIPDVVGMDLAAQLRFATESLDKDLPATADDLNALSGQLRQVLREHFPTQRIVRFEPSPRADVITIPQSVRRSARWKRIVRTVTDTLRRLRSH